LGALSRLLDGGYCIAATASQPLHRSDDFAFQSPRNGTGFVSRPITPREGGGRVVLNNLSEQIRECIQHAEDCARKAATLPDSSPFRQDFLNLEQRWLELARSIEFGERLESFTKNRPKPKINPPPPSGW
jgi:hypothetical protein